MGVVNKIKSISARATMNADDVRALLVKDHDEAKALAKEMHETSSATRRTALFNKLKPALAAHSRAEEKVVYDALLAVRSKDTSHEMADEGYVEHSLLDELLSTLSSERASTDRWKASAKVLHELLEHHIDEEQSDVFALLGEHFDRDQLIAMGAQFTRLKASILRAPKAAARGNAVTARRVATQRARRPRAAAPRVARSTRKSAAK